MSDLREFAEPLRRSDRFKHPALPLRDPWTIGDVHRMRTEPPPPVRWLVEGLIPASVPGILAARANAGKSMTALGIGMALAAGLRVMGRTVSPETPRGVIYAGLEDDLDEFHRRYSRGMELLVAEPDWRGECALALDQRFLPLFPDRTSGARFGLVHQWQVLADHAKRITCGCGLIVLDTLTRMAEGDENSASEMREFNEAASALVQETGASVMAIHHAGKGNDIQSDKKLWERLHAETLRGSSSLEAAARFVLTMAGLNLQEGKAAGFDAEEVLRGDFVALHLAKMNAAERGKTILLQRRHAPEPGAGFLAFHPDSERILSIIRGEASVLKLVKRDQVLVAIAEAGSLKDTEQKAAAENIWPDASNPKGQWDKALTALRNSGLLLNLHLTDLGWARVQTLGVTLPAGRGGLR